MNKYARWIVAFAVFIFLPFQSTQAQLPRDVRDMFEGMLEDLDSDLRAKFKKAIDDNTATVDFSPEEFRRFRSNPVNPFEGLDRIEATDNSGTISLKFELPSIRNRLVGEFERQNFQDLALLKPIVSETVPSVVAVFADDRQISLATVVDENGHMVSKLSEVKDKKYLKIVTSKAEEFSATIVNEDKENDLAILKAESTSLIPISWTSDAEPSIGSFVLTPAPNASVISLGTFGVTPRSTESGNQALLGVDPDDVPGLGVKITRLEENARRAGLRDNDIITRLAGKPIMDVTALVNVIREHRPNDTVSIEYTRRGQRMTTQATLAGRAVTGERAKRYKMMSRLGAIPSRRSDDFPWVFQHDGPIFPEQCGGPVVDLEGNVVGINIARNGRASTYAIPIRRVQSLVGDFLRKSVARKKGLRRGN